VSCCHGDRLVSARPDPAGGLSQPCRDTAGPKKIDYPFLLSKSIINSQATPCDRVLSNPQNIANLKLHSNLFSFFCKKMLVIRTKSPSLLTQKSPKSAKNHHFFKKFDTY